MRAPYLAVGAAVLLALAPSARAENIPKAKALYARSQELYGQGKYREAAQVLKEAYRNWKRRSLQYNIALCYGELGDKVNAVRHLRLYLTGATAKERADVADKLRRMTKQVGTLVVVVPDHTTTVWIDGRKQTGKAHIAAIVLPGSHAVEIKRGNVTVKHKEISVPAGGKHTWVVRLDAPSDPRRRAGSSGPEKPSAFSKLQRLHWKWFAILISVAGASALIAAGTGARTRQLASDYDNSPTPGERRQGITLQRATNAFWGITAITAVTAGVVAIFTRWKRREKPTKAKLRVGPGGASLTLNF